MVTDDPWDTSDADQAEVVVDRQIEIVSEHEMLPPGHVALRIVSTTKVDGKEVSVDVLGLEQTTSAAKSFASAYYGAARTVETAAANAARSGGEPTN